MITKITKENELEFFQRGFNAITEAFAKDNNLPNIVVNSLESYYGNLQYIKQLKTEKGEEGKFLLVPFDEPFFDIDANARTIAVPAEFKKNGVAVQGDHQAEMLVFKVDRYFDYQDLFETEIAINWNFVPYGSRQMSIEGHDAAFAKTLYYDANYVIFGFIITQDMTPSRGVLNFNINFFQPGAGSEEAFTYSLNTMVVSVNVNEGLVLENPSEVKKVNQSFLGRLGNSAYTPETMAPVADPEWTTGKKVDGVFQGLEDKANFVGEQDELVLHARAHVVGDPVKYRWNAAPILTSSDDLLVEDKHQAAEITEPDRATSANDYFETLDTVVDASKEYYELDGSIFKPLTSSEAQQHLNDKDIVVYELGSSYVAKMAGSYKVEAFGQRNTTVNNESLIATGNSIESNECVIPVAAKPSIVSVIATGVSGDFEVELPDGVSANPYTYIASGSAPEVKVNVALAEGETEEFGKLAVQLVDAAATMPTLAEAAALTYGDLENGELIVPGVSSAAGSYKVRVINKKNHTYRVSEPSQTLQFSEVAPAITNLTISGFISPDGSPVEVIHEGETYNGGEIEGSSLGDVIFTITNNATGLNPEYAISYFVDEVDNNGDVIELNKYEVINKQFTIPQNTSGNFRVRTENRYHYSMRTGITGKFIVNPIAH